MVSLNDPFEQSEKIIFPTSTRNSIDDMLFSDNNSGSIKNDEKEKEESKIQVNKKQNYQKWVKKDEDLVK